MDELFDEGFKNNKEKLFNIDEEANEMIGSKKVLKIYKKNILLISRWMIMN